MLIMIDDPKFLKKLAGIKEIPTLPEVMQDVISVLASSESSARDLAAILSKDQSLCSKILKIANSAFFAQSRRIIEIDDAVVLLGFDSVAQLMLATTVLKTSGPMHSNGGFDVYGFWEHSIATAMAGKAIARKIGVSLEEKVAYTAGLLHDIGKLVLLIHFGDEYASVLKKMESEDLFLFQAELAVLGFTHCDVSEWVCSRWNFPEALIDLIVRHHNDVCSNPQPNCRPCIIRLADNICNRLQIGNSGNRRTFELNSEDYACLQLEVSDISAIEESLKQNWGEMEKILGAIV